MNDKTKAIVRGTVGLFKAASISTLIRGPFMVSAYNCAKRGFMVVTKNGVLVEEIPSSLYDIITEAYGVDVEAFNQTFHKSFGHVADMNPAQYFMEQVMHYLTAYGAESIGVKMIPYVPVEELEIPGFEFNVKRLTVITALEGCELDDLINDYARNTVSPSPKHIELFKPLMERITIDTDDIKSFELQVIKHEMDGTFPHTALTAFRYLLYKTTGSTYAIKNHTQRQTIAVIERYPEKQREAARILNGVPVEVWGQIFLRYKPIFLAYKHAVPQCANTINRIRRAAVDAHRPLNDACLQNVTKLIAEDRMDEVGKILADASNRELIKVANAIGFRLSTYGDALTTPQVFNVRNGRSFVLNQGYHADKGTYNRLYRTLINITTLLRARTYETLKGKKFIIPEYIDYAVPTTEKQFIGNLPWGTVITGPDAEAFTAGVQWYNQGERGNHRVDIDLHMNSATEHFGWNGGFRDGRQVIYTGDQTSAPLPNGAAEAFWFQPLADEKFILGVNLFSGPQDMPFKFAISEEQPSRDDLRNEQFTFRNPIFAPVPLKFNGDCTSMTIGMFIGHNFHLFGGQLTSGIVPSGDYAAYVDGIAAQLNSKWMMTEFLAEMGAEVYEALPDGLTEEEAAEFIDLSPEALTATTLFDILDGNI